MKSSVTLCVALAALLLPAVAGAAAPGDAVRAARLQAPLELDGLLEEPAWDAAAPHDGFVQLFPDEGDPKYTGYNMWRGVAPWTPFLTGASMTRVGWLASGKMVIYPIRNDVDAGGRKLINWARRSTQRQFTWRAGGRCRGTRA